VRAAGFDVHRTRSVGLFRLPILTSHAPLDLLVALERVELVALAPITAGPSVFLKAVRRNDSPPVTRHRGHPGTG
jgi:hypothetical protein